MLAFKRHVAIYQVAPRLNDRINVKKSAKRKINARLFKVDLFAKPRFIPFGYTKSNSRGRALHLAIPHYTSLLLHL